MKTFYYSKFLKVLKYFPENKNNFAQFQPIWGTALTICKSYGMDLFSIDSKKEETLVLDLAAAIGDSFHIGLINAGTIDTWYSTKTGETVDFTLNWYGGQPNADGPKHRCTCIHPEGALKKITQSDCTNLFSFICEDYHYKDNCAPKDL